jgi:23S rRNA (cytosine1962-C5)-methyltransferase
MIARVVLKPRQARPFFAGHPWVYAGSIQRVVGDPRVGDEVTLESAEGIAIARGLWNVSSLIRVRLYRWPDEPLDEPFWRGQIQRALRLRLETPHAVSSNAQRLVYSEGDAISGLVVDRFDRWLLAQFTSHALWTRRESLVSLLKDETQALGALCRFDRSLAKLEGAIDDTDPFVSGEIPSESVEIFEGDVRFAVELGGGQKTGCYLDQSTNRAAVARYASGRRVLDLFCYTGGFSLHALKQGAASSLGLDSSADAVSLARQNAERNSLENAEFRVTDLPRGLAEFARDGLKFGLVVCDPPKYARTARDIDAALRAYAHLNRAAVELLEPGGFLASCSCSGHIDKITFQNMLAHVSELSKRPIQVLEMRGQAPDHPVAVACLETEYLKCAICRVS